jgi:hypothetical protein
VIVTVVPTGPDAGEKELIVGCAKTVSEHLTKRINKTYFLLAEKNFLSSEGYNFLIIRPGGLKWW